MNKEHITSMSQHMHLDAIRTYLKGCNTPNADLIHSTLAPDVVHYFAGREPIRGADTLTAHWVTLNAEPPRWTWTLDYAIVDGDVAVMEFTAIKDFGEGSALRIARGAEWYVFHDGRIAEIRVYPLGVSGKPVSELVGFPYAERGYTMAQWR